jgi:KaiC/GvpD/RAD55 family RecA-like ATPase
MIPVSGDGSRSLPTLADGTNAAGSAIISESSKPGGSPAPDRQCRQHAPQGDYRGLESMSSIREEKTNAPIAASGVQGLDEILGGGFTPRRLYLIEGVPGSGKTTLAMQFLLEGVRCQEPVLYVTLSETKEELEDTAASHGWSLDGITVHEVVPGENSLHEDEHYTMFHPSEVELNETTKTILQAVDQLKPQRVVFDSLSELRLLSGSPLRYRRQILSLKQYFAGRNCTVLLLDDMTSADRDLQVQSISHGVVLLEQLRRDRKWDQHAHRRRCRDGKVEPGRSICHRRSRSRRAHGDVPFR